MKSIPRIMSIVLLSCTLLANYPSVAQTRDSTVTTERRTDDNGDNEHHYGNWGLAGLLGLLGLLGLRNNNDVKHRTTVRQDNDENRATTTRIR